MNSKKIFNLISYLKYPFYLWGFYFLFQVFDAIINEQNGWEEINNFLILIGIGLAFSSLNDAGRKPNNISRRIWGNQTFSILIILFIALLICGLIFLGLSTFFFSQTYRSEAIAVGMIVLGIGMIGYLKYAVEKVENLK